MEQMTSPTFIIAMSTIIVLVLFSSMLLGMIDYSIKELKKEIKELRSKIK